MIGRSLDRRRFLARCAAAAAGCCAVDSLPFPRVDWGSAKAEDLFRFETPDGEIGLSDVRAMHWDAISDGRVICRLCPRECRVADRERGYCGVRENAGGVYKTLVHSRICAVHTDPVEKKPLFHVMPGANAFSLATAGCNIQCRFCQNWEISQFRPEQVESIPAPPEQVVAAARRAGAPLIAFTYSEPVVFYEYMLDIAKAGNPAGLKSLMISNGYIQEKPLRELLPHLGAVKIDLKGFTESFYREVCDGELAPVLRTLEILKETGTWFEIVVLVIPTLNDDEAQMKGLCGWVAERLGSEVPIHFTRFHPAYRIQNIPSTPVATLERVLSYAREAGLRFAYLGNVPGHPAESTYCPGCGATLIQRTGFAISSNTLRAGRCLACDRAIPGVWS